MADLGRKIINEIQSINEIKPGMQRARGYWCLSRRNSTVPDGFPPEYFDLVVEVP